MNYIDIIIEGGGNYVLIEDLDDGDFFSIARARETIFPEDIFRITDLIDEDNSYAVVQASTGQVSFMENSQEVRRVWLKEPMKFTTNEEDA